MRIGVLSDSHDRLEAIELAVTQLNEEGLQHVFHAGDIISPFTVHSFKPLKAKLHVVWGNNDGDKLLLTKMFEGMGAAIHGDFMETKLEGRKIAMTHGTNEAITKALAGCKRYDLVIAGHTHKPEIKREGPTLVLNPGAASGYLTQQKTIAVVDLEPMEAKLLTLT